MGLWWAAALVLGGAGALFGTSRYVSMRRRREQRATYPLPASLVIEPQEDAVVMRQPDGRWLIRWSQPVEDAQVFAGPSPQAIQHSAPAARGVHTDRLVVDALPGITRPYFELIRTGEPPLILAERFLTLEGVANVRDIGGYRTGEGRSVRWGQVYRTGSLAGATEADLNTLHELGIRLVCDLRSAEEVVDEPDRLPANPAPAYRHTPVEAGEQNRERMRALLFDPKRLFALMDEAYTRFMIDQNGPVFGDMLRLIAEDANRPAIIHCTAGKDRTGVTIALLLALLGVPDEVIVADYSLSNRFYHVFRDFVASKFRQPQAFLLGLHIDDFQPVLVAHPNTMRSMLTYIREHYGSVEAYLTQKAGLDADTLNALRAKLLV